MNPLRKFPLNLQVKDPKQLLEGANTISFPGDQLMAPILLFLYQKLLNRKQRKYRTKQEGELVEKIP